MHDGIVIIADAIATKRIVEVEVICHTRVHVVKIDGHVLVSVRPDEFVAKSESMTKFVQHDSFLYELEHGMIMLK